MRTHIRVILFSMLIVLTRSISAYAQRPAEDHVGELGVIFWKPSPELRLSTEALTNAGVRNPDLAEEFGIEDKYFPEFRATLGRTHKFRTSFVTFDYDAEATVTHTIVLRGQTINIGVPATADIKWKLYRFGYEWDFVARERGFFGVIADLKYNRVEASIDSPLLTSAVTTDTKAPVPTVGVIGRGYLAPAVSITGEFTGFSITRDDFEGKFFDFDLYGTVSIGRNFGVQAGYRSVVVDYLVDDDSGDLKMKGLYFGAILRF